MEGAAGDIVMTVAGDPSLSYAWTQTPDTVAVTVFPATDFKPKDVDVRITGTALFAGLKGATPLVSGTLFSRASKDDSAWVYDVRDGRPCIEVHLQKTYAGLWPHLMADPGSGKEAPGAPLDPQSLFEIAQRREVEGDIPGAIALLERAAERGGLAAILQLASMYRTGKEGGGPIEGNAAKAFELYTRAAAMGSAEAHFFLGDALQRGAGVERNPKRALHHYAVAAEATRRHEYTPVAAFQAGLLCHTGSPGAEHAHVAQDYESAVRWWRHAASLGYAPAHYNLGVMCMQGTGTKRDLSAARDHFSKAHGMDPGLQVPDLPPLDPAARSIELADALRRGSIAANIGDFGLEDMERRKGGALSPSPTAQRRGKGKGKRDGAAKKAQETTGWSLAGLALAAAAVVGAVLLHQRWGR